MGNSCAVHFVACFTACVTHLISLHVTFNDPILGYAPLLPFPGGNYSIARASKTLRTLRHKKHPHSLRIGTDMAPTILTMPAEILLEIAFLLDLDETYQLRNTSKGLFEALNGETFNQKVAKVSYR